MERRAPIASAPSALAVPAAVLVLAAVGAGFVAPSMRTLIDLAIGLVVVPVAVVLGILIVRRSAARVVGTLLAAVGLAVAVTVAKEAAWGVLAERPAAARSLAWLVALLDQSAMWILVAVALLLLYFPDGALPGPRWRPVPVVLVATTAVDQVAVAFEQVPFRPPLQSLARPFGPLPTWLELVAMGAFVTTLVLALACLGSLVVRLRRAGRDGDRLRQKQIRWLAVVGVAVVAYPLLCLLEILFWGSPTWVSGTIGVAGLLAIPAATAVAVLWPEVYDVDRVLSVTVTYSLVTAAVLALFGGISLLVGLLAGRGSPLAAATAAVTCALALAPLRARLGAVVDRRLYPLRRAASEAVETLHHDIRAERARPEDLEQVLRVALREPALRVGYRSPGGGDHVDARGEPVDPDGGTPVVLDGHEIGVITLDAGLASDDLLRDAAASAATLVELVRLRLELARVVREVEASRTRLLHVGYEERRRLERDLHDGAQQRLVSLGMNLRLAQRHLDDGTVDVDELLDAAVAELGIAVAELRHLAHGLRPTLLDDGLDAALRALVATVPMPVALDVTSGPLPDHVATTAFYVASEALTNSVKHASAVRLGVHVGRSDGQLTVRITDDGRGGARLVEGSALADRVAAMGGTLQVASPAGSGTVVEAILPCAS